MPQTNTANSLGGNGTTPYTYVFAGGSVVISDALNREHADVLLKAKNVLIKTTPGLPLAPTTTVHQTLGALVSVTTFASTPVAGASLWLDASQLTGLSNNDPVSSWPDLSLRGNSVWQVGSLRPLYKTNQQNGLPAVVFDSISQYLKCEPAASLNFDYQKPFSVFFTCKLNATPVCVITKFEDTRDTAGVLTTDKGWSVFFVPSLPAFELAMRGSPFSLSTKQFYPMPLTITAWNLFGATFDGTGNGSGMDIYTNTAKASANIIQDQAITSILTDYGARIGRLVFANDNDVGGGDWSLGELITFDRILAATEIASVHSYLKAKWGTP